ncbi:hypothetical protein GCM10023147_15020 [Tsukamurella soli]|uniref:Transcription regulator of the Arc/MetJ class n=1 Tax=Tsukamurella soli TaxID=644556 RepID=A0ABP8JDC0_9ACTN
MIFKGVLEGKPYPDHGLTPREWSRIPPRQVRLAELITTTTVLALDRLLSEDSTFFGDLFPHAVTWNGDTYLEDGLHRAVRSALRNRTVLHCRVFEFGTAVPGDGTFGDTSPGGRPPAGRSPLANLTLPPRADAPGPNPGPASGAESYGRHAVRPGSRPIRPLRRY